MQAAEGLLDEGDAELRQVGEVAVEGGRGDADLAGHLAQSQAAQALVFEQPQRRVEQRLPRLLLARLPDPDCLGSGRHRYVSVLVGLVHDL